MKQNFYCILCLALSLARSSHVEGKLLCSSHRIYFLLFTFDSAHRASTRLCAHMWLFMLNHSLGWFGEGFCSSHISPFPLIASAPLPSLSMNWVNVARLLNIHCRWSPRIYPHFHRHIPWQHQNIPSTIETVKLFVIVQTHHASLKNALGDKQLIKVEIMNFHPPLALSSAASSHPKMMMMLHEAFTVLLFWK